MTGGYLIETGSFEVADSSIMLSYQSVSTVGYSTIMLCGCAGEFLQGSIIMWSGVILHCLLRYNLLRYEIISQENQKTQHTRQLLSHLVSRTYTISNTYDRIILKNPRSDLIEYLFTPPPCTTINIRKIVFSAISQPSLHILTLVLLDPDIYVFKKVSTQINATEIDKIFSGGCSANQIFHFGRCLFFINSHIFRHLKLEIALAIPALNE